MENVKKHLSLLGRTVTDRVTNFKGVVESVGFDLYGCIQVIVRPSVGKDGKSEDARWFDVKCLKVIRNNPVMEVPDWDFGEIAEGKNGPADKSVPNRY